MNRSTTPRPRAGARIAIAVMACWLTSCGAGVVSGAILGRGDDDPPVAGAEPAVTMSIDRGPLEIEPNRRYEGAAVLSNIPVPVGFQVVVDFVLAADPLAGRAEIVVRQSEVVVDQGSTPTVRWRLETDPIRAAYPDPTAQDVPVTARIGAVRGADQQALGEGAFTLLRKPRASVPAGASRTVPVTGGATVLEITPRLSDDVSVEVGFVADRVGVARVDSRIDDLGSDTTRLIVGVPATDTPAEFELTVIDRFAGRSTSVDRLFFAPVIFAVVNRSGTTDGDQVMSLVGAGLIPSNFDSERNPTPDLARVEVVFRKSGNAVVVGPTSFLPQLSTPNALTLRSPLSPDGHPGPVSIEVRIAVPTASGLFEVVSDVVDDLYAYAAAVPQFEPRGLALDGLPFDIVFGRLATDGAAPGPVDVAALYSSPVDLVGLVRVLSGDGHGMFRRIGRFVPTGDPGVGPVLRPISLCVADIVGDSLHDVVVANIGLQVGGTSVATVLENSAQRPGLFGEYQLGPAVVQRVPRLVRPVRLDADGRDDLLVVAVIDAGFALSSERFAPRWVTAELASRFTVGQYLLAEPIDRDGDGLDEVVFFVRDPSGRVTMSTLHRPAVGAATLAASGPFDVSDWMAGMDPAALFSARSRYPDELFIVLNPSGFNPGNASSRLLRVDIEANWEGNYLSSTELEPSPSGLPFVANASLLADLDEDGTPELIVGSDRHGLRVYELGPAIGGQLVLRQSIESFDGETIGRIVSIRHERVDASRNALFVVHDAQLGVASEARITTLIVDASGLLRGPQARRDIDQTPRRLVAANERGDQIAVVFDDSLVRYRADEFGELTADPPILVPGIRPETVTRVDIDGVAQLAFLFDDRRIGLLGPDDTSVRVSGEAIVGGGVSPGPLAPIGNQIVAGDVDGDGLTDLVTLVSVELSAGSSNFESVVVVSRGTGDAQEFPFIIDPRVDDGGRFVAASSIALGNFARSIGAEAAEIAVAVPAEGVHMLRFDAASNRLQNAHAAPGTAILAAGREPEVVRAIDLDESGIDDLVILSTGRSQLQFYVQQEPRIGLVHVAGYELVDEASIPVGGSAELTVADVDGDAIADFVVVVLDEFDRPTVGVLLWDGADRIGSSFALPFARVGTTPPGVVEPRAFVLTTGDTNRDGVPDLLLGWEADSVGVQTNHIRTLFGSRR